MLNKKKLFLFAALVILLIGVVSATELSNDTLDDSTEVTDTVDESSINAANVVNENDYVQSDVEKTNNQNIITKKYNQTTKEATNNVYVSNYKEFVEQLELATKSKEKVYTINLKPGKYDVSTSIYIETKKNSQKIIINGNNQTLNGNKFSNSIYVNIGDTLELNDITFNNYNVEYPQVEIAGGATLDLYNTKFTNYKVDNHYTSIISNRGYVNIGDSYFINNTVSSILINRGKLSLNNTYFINNNITKSYYEEYGLINIGYNESNTLINNTNFINNYNSISVNDDKAVIYARTETGPVKIHNSNFLNNSFRSGSVYAKFNTTFEIRGCSFEKGDRGPIFNLGNMTIIDTKISEMKRHPYYGDQSTSNYGNMLLNNVTVISDEDGWYNAGNMTISKSNFVHTNCWGIIINDANLTIYDSNFLDNVVNKSCIVIRSSGNTILNNTILRNNKGGAIFNEECNEETHKTVIIDSTIENSKNIYGNELYPITINFNKITSKQYAEYFNITGKYSCVDNITNDIPLQITYNEKVYNVKTDANGFFNLNLKANTIGTNKVSIHYEGTHRLRRISGSDFLMHSTDITYIVTFNVTKCNTKLAINPVQSVKVGENAVITGKFTDKNNNPLTYTPLNLKIDNQEVTIKTDGKGIFNTTYKTTKAGTINITATYPGNARYATTTTKTIFTVNDKTPTYITLNDIKEVLVGNSVTISGRYYYGNNIPLTYTPMRLNINGEKVTAKTDANGYFTYSYKTSRDGPNNVTVSYPGNARFKEASVTKTFSVRNNGPQYTYIILNNIKEVAYGSNTTISGFYYYSNDVPLTYTPMRIKINGQQVLAKTDAKGFFTYSYKTEMVGKNTVTVSYPGNANFKPATVTKTFNVKITSPISTYITLNSIKEVTNGNTVTISGHYYYGNNMPLTYTTMRLNINGQQVTAKTDANGYFTYNYKTTKDGSNTVTVSYPGNSNFKSATATKTFNVKSNGPQYTYIKLNSIKEVTVGNTVTISGYYLYGNDIPLTYTTMRLKINGQQVTAKTDAKGYFTYTYKTTKSGTNNVTVTYPGNNNFKSATITKAFNVKK